jgi:hypothetical protein
MYIKFREIIHGHKDNHGNMRGFIAQRAKGGGARTANKMSKKFF